MKCFTSMSVEGNTTTYSASNTTLNTESRMSCTTYKKQTYLNNLPPDPHLVILSKASHMAALFSFYGQKKGERKSAPEQDCIATWIKKLRAVLLLTHPYLSALRIYTLREGYHESTAIYLMHI